MKQEINNTSAILLIHCLTEKFWAVEIKEYLYLKFL